MLNANDLSEQAIRNLLTENGDFFDLRLHVCDSVDSTNDYVMSLSREAGDGVLACVANHQLKGKGRNGAVWQSPSAANIYMSLGMRYQVASLHDFGGLSLACGVAVAKFMEDLGVCPRLKWPNDILVDGKKLAGILIETRIKGAAIFVVIGIGVNVDMSESEAKDIDQPWTDLKRSLPVGSDLQDRNKLIAGLLAGLVSAYKLYQQAGVSAFIESWQAYDVLRGKNIRVYTEGKELLAEALGVNEDGSLRVAVDGHEESVYAADVKIRLEN